MSDRWRTQQQLPGVRLPVKKGNLGKMLEDLLTETHNYYRSRGIASVDQNPRQWHNVKGKPAEQRWFYENAKNPVAVAKTRSGQYMYSKRSPVDFAGTVAGRAIYFDAKQTQGKSIPFDPNFEAHQIDYVVEKQRHGALAGFMIYFTVLDRLFFAYANYVERVFVLAKRSKENRQSIALAQCEEFGREIPKDPRLHFFDWERALFKREEKETPFYGQGQRQATTQPETPGTGEASPRAEDPDDREDDRGD